MAPDLALGTIPQLLLKDDAQVYMPFVGDMVHHHEPVEQVRGSRDDESTDSIDMRGIWPSENGRSARYSIPRAKRGRWNGDTLDSI